MANNNDEIDIRPYILLLKKKWWVIALFAIIPAVITLFISLMLPRKYISTATILLNRSRPVLSLADQFPTLNEPVDTRSRMDALLSIAQSDEIASSTYQEFLEKIQPDSPNLSEFRQLVQIKDRGDTIQIIVSNQDANLAMEIANTWASRVVSAINLAYSGQQLPTELEAQVEAAKIEYEGAQKAYEEFISTTKIDYLDEKVTESTNLLSVISQQRAEEIAYLAARIQAMKQIAQQAQALKEQISNGSASKAAGIGDALAVIKARANSFNFVENSEDNQTENTNPANEFIIQFTDPADLIDNQALYIRELETIIKQAEVEENNSLEDIQSLVKDVVEGSDEQLNLEMVGKINQLKTELEEAESQEKNILGARDLAWQAYQALAQKKIEIETSAETNSLVSLAARAISAERPAPRGTISNVLIAGIAGGILGIFFVVLQYWWVSTNNEKEELQISD